MNTFQSIVNLLLIIIYLTNSSYGTRIYKTEIGCFEDLRGAREMELCAYKRDTDMTIEKCANFCQGKQFPYMALQVGKECRCGLNYNTSRITNKNECDYACGGMTNNQCGGYYIDSIYRIDGSERSYEGCYKDGESSKTFRHNIEALISDDMTIDMCEKHCKDNNYEYMGLQNSKECRCGHSITQDTREERFCFLQCKGVKDQKCGGGWRNSVYLVSDTIYVQFPEGCYQSSISEPDTLAEIGGMTTQKCFIHCRNYEHMAIREGRYCWCTNSITTGFTSVSGHRCSTNCYDNKKCGASGNRELQSVYRISELQPRGCYEDPDGSSSHHVGEEDNMTIELCGEHCYNLKYRALGIKNGVECECLNSWSTRARSRSCDQTCVGNSLQTCGGDGVISVYEIIKYNDDSILGDNIDSTLGHEGRFS